MTADVQRYDLDGDRVVMYPLIDGDWVRFIAHVAAVQAARDEVWNAALDAIERDVRAIPHDPNCRSHRDGECSCDYRVYTLNLIAALRKPAGEL